MFILESPIKVKTIEKFLGGDYIIRASVGHIADMSERTGPDDVSNAFAATYELITKGNEKIGQTDINTEGELIGAHLAKLIS